MMMATSTSGYPGVAVVGPGAGKLQRRVVVRYICSVIVVCIFWADLVRFLLQARASTPEEGVPGCPRLTVDAVAGEGEHRLAHDDGQRPVLLGRIIEAR